MIFFIPSTPFFKIFALAADFVELVLRLLATYKNKISMKNQYVSDT